MNPEPSTLVALAAIGHAPDMWPAIIGQAENAGADVIAYSEAYRQAGLIAMGDDRYQGVVATSSTKTRAVKSPHGDAGDNPISVSKRLRIRARRAARLTKPGGLLPSHAKFAPERWGYVVAFDWEGTQVRVISIHPNPLFTGPRKWWRVMRWAAEQVRQAKIRGQAVIVLGDLQTKGLVKVALRGLGLQSWVAGVTWVLWSGLTLSSVKTMRPTGMDHDWVKATFVKPVAVGGAK